MGGAVADALTLLDPRASAEAGAPHGQLASGLTGGGLSLSCHKLVEDAARATVLLVPGVLRLDARPVQDTLQVMTRSLHAERVVRWNLLNEHVLREYKNTADPFRMTWAIEVPLQPRAILGRVDLVMTADLEHGLAHFVTQAVLREASA
jgi:hypothetical protein